MNTNTKYLNGSRLEIEGTFDLSAGAAVNSLTVGIETVTVRGESMAVVKNGTGTYDVTVKLASTIAGSPVFQPVNLLFASASLVGVTVATALSARVQSVAVTSTGDLLIKVITAQTTGAAADTTGAITVAFHVIIATNRQNQVI